MTRGKRSKYLDSKGCKHYKLPKRREFISKLKLIGRIVDCCRKRGTVAFFCGAPKSKLRKVEKVDVRKACLDKGHKKTDRTSTNDYFEMSKRGFLIMFGHRLKIFFISIFGARLGPA
jgi:hypothetical protein